MSVLNISEFTIAIYHKKDISFYDSRTGNAVDETKVLSALSLNLPNFEKIIKCSCFKTASNVILLLIYQKDIAGDTNNYYHTYELNVG